MTEEESIKHFVCGGCGGEHNSDPDDSYVIFEGYRYTKPYRCMCCGKEICARQFAYGRACGPCDMGACQSGNKAWNPNAAHPHPEWRSYDPEESRRKFAEVVGAVIDISKFAAADE